LTIYYLAGVTSDTTNSPHPQIEVTNSGTGPVSLNNVEVRYWFNCDCTTQTVQSWVDWAGLLPAGTSVTDDVLSTVQSTTLGGQTNYISYKFTGNLVLQPGQSIEIQGRFNKSDYSNMVQDNDWSFTPYTSFTEWTKITGYLNGTLVWGEEPTAVTAPLNLVNVVSFPNPTTTGSASLYYQLASSDSSGAGGSAAAVEPNGQIHLKIFTTGMRLVWSQTLMGETPVSAGGHTIAWDGKDSYGNSLANGLYYFQVVMQTKGQSTSKTSPLLILK